MIPLYQRFLFYGLLASIMTMAFFLFYERQRVRERLDAKIDAAPLLPPIAGNPSDVTLDLANDHDGTITAVQQQLVLPEEQSVRARALLDRLMAEYALPRSGHPMPSGAAVDDVFLVKNSSVMEEARTDADSKLALINLRGDFVSQHPAGLQTEMLSLLSMLGTLHANFPEVAEVEFVVDGRVRETVAGHADLQRVYPAIDTTIAASEVQPAP